MTEQTDIGGISQALGKNIAQLDGLLRQLEAADVISPDGEYRAALEGIQAFSAIALRIIARTNASKVREAANAVRLQALGADPPTPKIILSTH